MLSQNSDVTVSQPRKNSDKYLKVNNTFGNELQQKYDLTKLNKTTHICNNLIIFRTT